jgi:hypothetical protein
MRRLLLAISFLTISHNILAQGCCSGGSGSPVAGGTSQGVLAGKQAEIGTSFQYLYTKKFLTGDSPAPDFLSSFNTKYLYTRFAYGVTERLTMSIEAGYFFNKTQVSLNKKVTDESRGFSDLIIFPRYKIYEHNTEKTRDEITVGLGYKIPIGKYLDSTVVYTDATGKNFYTPLPPAVMPTTGSNDFILYGFAFRGYPEKKFRIFANALYIRKGWNPLGEKFGDYASLGLFASKTFLKNWGATLQLKGEWIGDFRSDKSADDMLAFYNIDVNSFGSKKIAIAPQISYSHKTFSVYLLSEYPLYQYVNGTAIASQYLFTLGLSYRFFMAKQNG